MPEVRAFGMRFRISSHASIDEDCRRFMSYKAARQVGTYFAAACFRGMMRPSGPADGDLATNTASTAQCWTQAEC